MGLTGLEPVTFRLSAECSNQLSYKPKPIDSLAQNPGKGALQKLSRFCHKVNVQPLPEDWLAMLVWNAL